MKTSIIHAARRPPPGREAGFISSHSALLLLGLVSVFGFFSLFSLNDCKEAKRMSPITAQDLDCSPWPPKGFPDRLTKFYLYANSHLKNGEDYQLGNFLKATGLSTALILSIGWLGRKIKSG